MKAAHVVGGASLAIWGYLLLARGGFWRVRQARRAAPAARRIAAVIPARNEAGLVGKAVASLAGQAEVIVVDDHSTDGTAEAARGAMVVQAGSLPEGWSGKLWAISEGLRLVGDAEFVLLTDADIVHAPGSVAELAGRAEAGGYDLVSVMALLRCESLAERMLVPAFVFFFFMLYPPRWIADPKKRTAGAAGGCILVRREMLERIGGVAPIRGEVIDDCALAAAVKRAGGRLRLAASRDVRSLRSYGGFDEIGRMISRTAFAQLRHSGWLLAGTVSGMALTYLAPPVLALRGEPLGAAAWAAMSAAYAPMLRFYGRSVLWAPLLPLVALFYTGATVHSAVRYWSGRGGEWKGRTQDATGPRARLPRGG